ncbi:hypothetical protein RYX36_020460 [Vicia faba]
MYKIKFWNQGYNSGHYIAHIKDENTGQWWEFDDRVVTSLGSYPFSEEASCSASKSVKNDVDHSNFSEEKVDDSNINGLSVKFSQSLPMEIFSFSDAYMLMYHLKNTKQLSKNGGMISSDKHTKRDVDSVIAQLKDKVLDKRKGAENHNPANAKNCIYLHLPRDSEVKGKPRAGLTGRR